MAFEVLVLSIIAIISTIKAVSYGVWTFHSGNTKGAISVVFLALLSGGLVIYYIVSLVLIL